MSDKSIIYIPQPNANAKIQLLCIPYAGGSARAFYHWHKHLQGAELCLVNYPGRGHRIREKPILKIDALLQTIFNSFKGIIRGNFAIFGHSMGSTIAYGLATRLEEERIIPQHLIVSGAAAPKYHLHNPLSQLSETDFIHTLTNRYQAIPQIVLKDAELMKMFIPLIRTDVSLEEEYINTYNKKLSVLSCNITALGGLQDPSVTQQELSTWSTLTNKVFQEKLLPGGHFYLNENQKLFFKELKTILKI